MLALMNHIVALKWGDSVDSMILCMIDLYNENSRQKLGQKVLVMNILRKFERMVERAQYRLLLEQGFLKVDDPKVKRTSDSWYEVSSTEESDVATSSSDDDSSS